LVLILDTNSLTLEAQDWDEHFSQIYNIWKDNTCIDKSILELINKYYLLIWQLKMFHNSIDLQEDIFKITSDDLEKYLICLETNLDLINFTLDFYVEFDKYNKWRQENENIKDELIINKIELQDNIKIIIEENIYINWIINHSYEYSLLKKEWDENKVRLYLSNLPENS
jgi:hypothetical protein